jgi:hypothetical protein
MSHISWSAGAIIVIHAHLIPFDVASVDINGCYLIVKPLYDNSLYMCNDVALATDLLGAPEVMRFMLLLEGKYLSMNDDQHIAMSERVQYAMNSNRELVRLKV